MLMSKNGGHIQSTGNFLFCLLITMVFNLQWLAPVAISLILHFWIGFPPLWIILSMVGIWFTVLLIQLLILRWAASKPTKQTASNKNPYSSSGYVPGGNKNPYSSNGYQTDESKKP